MSGKPTAPGNEPTDLGRRRFLAGLLGRSAGTGAAEGESEPGRCLMLEDLPRLPDRVLGEVVPVFRSDGGFVLGEQGLYGPDQGCLWRSTPQDCYALQRFGSGANLGDIGRELEEQFHLSSGEGFTRVRRLFLSLAAQMICHPAGPNTVEPQDG